jgi:hypothetical protein
MVQWVQIYETSDEILQNGHQNFQRRFPFISIWRGAIRRSHSRRDHRESLGRSRCFHRTHARSNYRARSLPRRLLRTARSPLSRSRLAEKRAYIPKPDDAIHSDYYPILDYMAEVGFFVGSSATVHDLYDETKSPRAQTLLGQYLRTHTLTVDDFRVAAQAAIDFQFADPNLTYSLMQRWAVTQTNTTLPLEMIERLLPERPAALTEELRLLPQHAWLMEQGKRDIAALHFYERVLMRAYRFKRSIFYIPDTGPLQEVLGLLVERDPKNRRVFDLHLAELAWDRGDDIVATRYGLSGLSPDTANTIPYLFTLDELAPRQVLTDLIDSALWFGQIRQAATLAKLATQRKFLTTGEFYFAPLDMACRKTAAAIEAIGAPPVAVK